MEFGDVAYFLEIYQEVVAEMAAELRNTDISVYYMMYLKEVLGLKEQLADMLTDPRLRPGDKLKAMDQQQRYGKEILMYFKELGFDFKPFAAQNVQETNSELQLLSGLSKGVAAIDVELDNGG